MKKAIIGGLLVIMVVLTMTGIAPSCSHETLNLAQFDTVCFERDIFPVFKNGCATTGCHSGGGEGMTLNTYEGIMRGVTAGSPSQSRVYQAMTSTLNQPMPPSHALAESDRIRIRIWIEQGARQTFCPSEPRIILMEEGGLK
jgi:hypothetical protein